MTFPRLRLPSLFLAGLIVCGWGSSSELWAKSPKTCNGTGAQLTAAEVQTILEGAASAFNLQNIMVAVVDRPGNILGLFGKPGADGSDDDLAVSLARTGAFFSNN